MHVQAMLSNLSGMFGDVRVSVLHALSMCMQKDMIFREDVAQVCFVFYACGLCVLTCALLQAHPAVR